MKKCEHHLVITNEHGKIEYEIHDRKARIMKRTIDYLLDNKYMSAEELITYMKERKVLRIDHLIKYAFTRGD